MNDISVTVIMPIRNEQDFIERSLGAVLAQDYPAEAMEIIIADGLSDDHTLECIEGMVGPKRVNIIHNPRRTQAAGLNEALKLARGDVIVRVDGHTVIALDYVRLCVALLQTRQAAVVGGNMTAIAITPMGQAIAAALNSGIAVPAAFHFSQIEQFTDTVFMGAWKRQILEEFRGFNERVGVNEDYELSYRIRRAGHHVLLCPRLQATYYGRETLMALARQYWRYGWSRVQTIKRYPRSLRLRHLVAPVFVAALLIITLASIRFAPLREISLGLILGYLVIIGTLSLKIARRTQVRVSYLFLAIVTIHMVWGFGFWKGLMRWHTPD